MHFGSRRVIALASCDAGMLPSLPRCENHSLGNSLAIGRWSPYSTQRDDNTVAPVAHVRFARTTYPAMATKKPPMSRRLIHYGCVLLGQTGVTHQSTSKRDDVEQSTLQVPTPRKSHKRQAQEPLRCHHPFRSTENDQTFRLNSCRFQG